MNKKLIEIYYDKDCPFCKRYTEFLKLKDNYELKMINARENKRELKEICSKLDINDGFIVVFENSFFQGTKALEFLNRAVDKNTLLGKLHFLFKYNNLFSKALYKLIFILRKVTLFIINKKHKI
ncbi:hypothetical protein AAX29_01124 [Aliarcobacter thereius]|uniref:DUF393 domain-containing protein n=1 Tax=Aliarcobacter thereius TaxID=544718 RepID=A0A1C0B702_9BACT|nr:DCC1-like thiol-disulfide oxidoreductase family protein [Aliarcobacter thereius]OCL91166.1 hypothetical protein AAX25_01336 [Aliarcobacter thereius]OCL99312.1 hypothetical protein AAX29_01124 [Aliarcobacter thereius]TLS71892.1 DUF393 domain-containing protein [Aliarcobacter thereius]